jgi:hypothetical protein
VKATHLTSAPALLERGDSDPNARAELVRQAWQILLPLMVVAGLIALWLATGPSAGTVIVSSQVKVDPSRRIVQHRERAIAPEILVRDEARGRAGQSLVVAEHVRSDSNLRLLQYELRAARILER